MPSDNSNTIIRTVQRLLRRLLRKVAHLAGWHGSAEHHTTATERRVPPQGVRRPANTPGQTVARNGTQRQGITTGRSPVPNPADPRNKRLNLPFMKRRHDAGETIYRHRTAICITIICYLVFAICFVSAKVMICKNKGVSTIIVDFDDLDKLQEEMEKAQELNRLLNEDRQYGSYDNISNRISNAEGAESDEILNRNGSMSEIYNNAAEVQGRVKANRDRFEKGLREEQEMIDRQKNTKKEGGESSATAKVKGKVTVSYSLNNPLRNAEYLYIPAYRCEGGGEVVVKIAVNRNGDVTEASVDTSQSSSDYCMTTTAVAAAKQSRFDVNPDAPEKQYGTIEYVFIPQ